MNYDYDDSLKYEGKAPDFRGSQSELLWVAVNTQRPVGRGEIVKKARIDEDLTEIYQEVNFWRFHDARIRVELEFRRQIRDERLVKEAIVNLMRISDYIDLASLHFSVAVRDRYNLWGCSELAVRDGWKLVEIPVSGGVLVDAMNRLFGRGRQAPPPQEEGGPPFQRE